MAVIRIALIRRVEPEEPQIAREFSEMSIRDEPRTVPLLQTGNIVRAGGEGSGGKDLQRHWLVNVPLESDRHRLRLMFVLCEDQIDFRMRHAARLDHVLHRGLLREATVNYARVTEWTAKKRPQVAAKGQPHIEHEPTLERNHLGITGYFITGESLSL